MARVGKPIKTHTAEVLTCIDSASQLLSRNIFNEHLKQRAERFQQSKWRYEKYVEQETKKQQRLRQREHDLRESQTLATGVGLPFRSNSNPHDIDTRFVSLGRLGGSHDTVVDKVQEVTTKEIYACKRIYFTRVSAYTSAVLERKARAEVEIMGKLNHDHIAKVRFHIKTTECHSIFMTPVADQDLLQYLEDCEKQLFHMDLTDPIFRWFGSLLQALEYAHQRGVKHRDIKPSNILIKDGRPYLADFGLSIDFTKQAASSSHSMFVQGTPVYFAPENTPGGDHRRQADVFALGCVFSEMLTVANKLSLQDFQSYRCAEEDNICGPHAFRASLDKVRRWLNEEIPQKGPYNTRLVSTIIKMIEEDQGKRCSAQAGVEALAFEPGLFCPVNWSPSP